MTQLFFLYLGMYTTVYSDLVRIFLLSGEEYTYLLLVYVLLLLLLTESGVSSSHSTTAATKKVSCSFVFQQILFLAFFSDIRS